MDWFKGTFCRKIHMKTPYLMENISGLRDFPLNQSIEKRFHLERLDNRYHVTASNLNNGWWAEFHLLVTNELLEFWCILCLFTSSSICRYIVPLNRRQILARFLSCQVTILGVKKPHICLFPVFKSVNLVKITFKATPFWPGSQRRWAGTSLTPNSHNPSRITSENGSEDILNHTRWCASSLAKLIYNSNFTMVYGRYIELPTMASKPTYNWGEPPCGSVKKIQRDKCINGGFYHF